MKIKKIIGLALIAIGIALITINFVYPSILEEIPFLNELEVMWIIVISLVVAAVGFLLAKNKAPTTSGQKNEEVPIYKGDKIVGYRKR
ncbi:MAG: hypothetical protein ACOCRO_11090 [Halanaerobiales bacterium]